MYFKFITIIASFFLLISCWSNNKTDTLGDKKNNDNIRIKTVYGDVIINLETQKSPLTTERVRFLTNQGFYNGLEFHKVIPNYVVQVGDPFGTGDGGSGQKLKAEKNELSHVMGSVSMVRNEDDPNSADSQFFICLSDCSNLDGKYTIFGKVSKGLEYAKKIKRGDKIIDMTVE